MKKDLLTLLDLEKNDFEGLFDRAIQLKKRHKHGISENSLAGKTLGLLFDKHSTRTRISFETAIIQMGGTPIFINAKDTQIARDEPVKDTARVLSRFIEALAIRTYSQDYIEEFAKYSKIPIINALTDLYHPCQILSDLMTVIEKKGSYDVKIAWFGDGNNVANSWINAASILGFELVLACPKDYFPNNEVLKKAKKNNDKIVVTDSPLEAAKEADVIYTDVWASMGQEEEQESRKKVFFPFQVNNKIVEAAKKDVIVMHCLPAHRDEEIIDEVLEGPNSVVWDQSENKRHMHKAILELLMTQNGVL